MAEQTKSSVIGIKEETTEGELIDLAAGSEFTAIREGFSVQGAVETVDSDELVNDIGASASFVTKEVPTSSISKYLKHSGVEGQAPDYATLVKSAMGSQVDNATEYNTVAGSTAGTSVAAGVIKVDIGEGSSFARGQAMLVKDGANGYNIRNVRSVAGDDLSMNFNLPSAPGTGVNLGKAVHFAPQADGHPTYSMHHYQSSSAASSLHQAVAGCRTTSITMNMPANDLASIDFEIEGIRFYFNPVVVDVTNDKIDFVDVTAGLELTASLENKAYQSPKDFAAEVSAKMTAASTNGDTMTCSFDSQTGRYTISSDGAYLDLDFATGTNAGASADTLLGFSADESGFTSYTGTPSTYSTNLTPAYDDSSQFVVKNQEFLMGDFGRIDCRDGNNFSLSIGTPKTDDDSFCAESGVSESIVLEREVTASATLVFKRHELDEFDAMINNKTTQLMFNAGEKDSAGNWEPGKCINVWMPLAKITTNTIADQDGYLIVEVEAKGFVSSTEKDVHLNWV